MPGLIVGAILLVLMDGQVVHWQKEKRFNTIGECEQIMASERRILSAEYRALIATATCTLGKGAARPGA